MINEINLLSNYKTIISWGLSKEKALLQAKFFMRQQLNTSINPK